jgi:hypothetical protein
MQTIHLPDEQYVASVVNGFYQINFRASNFNRLITTMAIQGPSGSTLNVYLDSTTFLFDTTPRGDLNSADYGPGRPVPRGHSLLLIWSTGVGSPIPFCTASFVRV